MHVENAALGAVGWRKASYSGGGQNSCVEVGAVGGGAGVRDSKVSSGPVHLFTSAAWNALTEAVKK